MTWEKHIYSFTVKEGHLDTFGHVNNAAYLSIFEEARWDWINRGGYGFERIHREKKGPVLLEVNLRFRRELKLHQEVQIESQVESISELKTSKIFEVVQKMISNEAGIHCEARFKIGFFDMTTRKLIQPPAEWLKAIGWTQSSSHKT